MGCEERRRKREGERVERRERGGGEKEFVQKQKESMKRGFLTLIPVTYI